MAAEHYSLGVLYYSHGRDAPMPEPEMSGLRSFFDEGNRSPLSRVRQRAAGYGLARPTMLQRLRQNDRFLSEWWPQLPSPLLQFMRPIGGQRRALRELVQFQELILALSLFY